MNRVYPLRYNRSVRILTDMDTVIHCVELGADDRQEKTIIRSLNMLKTLQASRKQRTPLFSCRLQPCESTRPFQSRRNLIEETHVSILRSRIWTASSKVDRG